MLRNLLDHRHGEVQNNVSTPLRGGDVIFPRIRLVDKHAKLAQIPIYSASPASKATGCPSSTLRDKIAAPRPENWPPQLFNRQRQSCTADRFIPQRYRRNLDAINYSLTKIPPRPENPIELDIFEQIASLNTTWRKRMMKNALERANIFEALNNQRVLKLTEHRKNREIITTEENFTDGIWKSRARNKPLIGRSDFTIKTLGNTINWMPGMLDWGAKNSIATVIDQSIIIFDATNPDNRKITKHKLHVPDLNATVFAVKWNHAGTAIAVVTAGAKVQVHSMEKFVWSKKCCCMKHETKTICHLSCVTWTHNDRQIVTGCSEGHITAYESSSGELIDGTFLHTFAITAVAFSPNDHYLASISNALRLHAWPGLTPYLEIGPLPDRAPVKSLAWHPWQANILCIGGCPDDDCLSLWNINHPKCLGYRKVPSVCYVNDITWNKLSGELVVQWRYLSERRYKSVVAVLESFDRVVDVVCTKFQTSDLTWGPDNTQLAMRVKGQIKSWNFFGNETKKWHDPAKENDRKKRIAWKSRKAMHNDQTIYFQHYNIR